MASKNKVAESKAARRKARQRKANIWPWLIGAGIVAIIAIPAIVNAVQSSNLPGESFSSQGNAHITLGDAHPAYNSDPPTSGWHTPDLAGFGSYDYLIPEERIIHSMEDGAVVLWYTYGSPEDNEEHIQRLEEVAQGYRRVVIAPRENMETTYALTAWTRLQRFDEIDEEGMRAFLEAFEGIDHHAG